MAPRNTNIVLPLRLECRRSKQLVCALLLMHLAAIVAVLILDMTPIVVVLALLCLAASFAFSLWQHGRIAIITINSPELCYVETGNGVVTPVSMAANCYSCFLFTILAFSKQGRGAVSYQLLMHDAIGDESSRRLAVLLKTGGFNAQQSTHRAQSEQAVQSRPG